MKKKIFSVLLALVLLLSFSLIPAVPVGAVATLEVSKWTESSANPIFAPDAKAYYPTVVKLSANDYRMWYGSNSGVGYATSPDGLSWAEEVNPVSGLTSANHPLVGCYIEGFVGSNVGDNPSADTMYYRIWYWDTAQLYSVVAIRYAESPDGITWYNDQPLQQVGVPIISGVHPEWNRGSYGPCDVLYNPDATNTGTDWVFTMYYDGTTGGDESIGVGFSSDGITWTGYDSDSDGKADPVLTRSGSGWDATYVSRCTVIKGDDQYRMWFSGGDGRMDHGIGYATSSDGLTWTKDANNPIFHKDDGVAWRDERTYCPMVIEDGGIYKMWFSGKDTATGNYTIGYATNTNPDAPYTTIQAAIDVALPEDTISVAAGTYNEVVKIGKPLTLLGAQAGEDARIRTGPESIIDPNNPEGGWPYSWVVRVESSNVTVDGFTVQNPTLEYGAAGLFHVEAPGWVKKDGKDVFEGDPYLNLVFRNNILQNPGVKTSPSTSFGKFGYNIGPCENVLIEYNYIRDILCNTATPWNGTAGIWLWTTDNVTIRHNKIENVTTFGIGLSDDNRNVLIFENEVSMGDPGEGAVPSVRTAGIRVGPVENYDIRIESNSVSDCPGTVENPGAGIRIQSHLDHDTGSTHAIDNVVTGCPVGIDARNHIENSTTLAGNRINGCDIGIRLVEGAAAPQVDGNTFEENNLIQVLDEAEILDIQQVLDTNTFYRAVVVDHAGSLLHTIWSSIQDAIDAALDGDTIFVAAGTYDETITFATDFAKDNLTIEGDAADHPVVTAGVHFVNSSPITDLSLKNLYLKGDGSGGLRNYIIDMKQPPTGEVNNFSIDNCVIDGENVADRCGICGRHFGQDFTITNTEFKNVLGWALMDIHSGSGDGASSLPLATVTFANNDVHDCNGSIALRGHATTKTTTVNAYGNTFTNIGGNEGEVGQHWAALEINHAVTANVYDNTVNGVSESEWGEGQAFQFWDIDTLNVYGNDITNNYQGIFIYGGEEGGTYGGPYAIPDGSISFNNIVGNDQYGIEVGANATGGPLNAKNNWWGTKAKGLIKKMVNDNVDYDPWIGAKAKDSKSQKTKGGGVTVDAKDKTDTDVLKKGKGKPTITVTEYTDNPGDGAPGGFSSVGKYIDVHLDDTTDVDEIEIRNYYTLEDIAELDETSLKLSWWNGTAWIECSDSGATYPDGGPTYRGYVWAIIRADTIPTLDDMAGTAFMAMGRPPAPPAAGVGFVPPAPPPGTTDVRGMVSDVGVFLDPVTAISEDELCTLTIPKGTVALTEELEPLTEITVLIMDEPPPPPEASHVIGLVYDLGPDGATFDPPITLTFSYDPANIPEGVAEGDLVLAFYDEATGEWIELEGCVVDPVTHTITAPVSHFTVFAIVGYEPIVPPVVVPAAFSVGDLSISPSEVYVAEAVSIGVMVTNTGGEAGSYEVTLKINGVIETTKEVTVDAGLSKVVTFSLSKDIAGAYSLDVNGLSGSFTVKEKPVPVIPKPIINWPLIGGIIGGVIAIGLLAFFLIRRRASLPS